MNFSTENKKIFFKLKIILFLIIFFLFFINFFNYNLVFAGTCQSSNKKYSENYYEKKTSKLSKSEKSKLIELKFRFDILKNNIDVLLVEEDYIKKEILKLNKKIFDLKSKSRKILKTKDRLIHELKIIHLQKEKDVFEIKINEIISKKNNLEKELKNLLISQKYQKKVIFNLSPKIFYI
jgi:chromosome segregation ATPase